MISVNPGPTNAFAPFSFHSVALLFYLCIYLYFVGTVSFTLSYSVQIVFICESSGIRWSINSMSGSV